MYKSCMLIIALVLASLGLNAQETWSEEFPKEVNFVKTTPLGVAIVGTQDALYGYNEKGEKLWENPKLKKVEKLWVEHLSGSELLYVIDKGMLGRNRVINMFTGEIYMEDLFVLGAQVVHPTNDLWIIDQDKSVHCIDIESKTEKWAAKGYDVAFYGHHFIGLGNGKITLSGNQPFTYTSRSTAIVHPGAGTLGEIDLNTGKYNWAVDFKPFKFKKPGKKDPDATSAPADGFATMKLNNDRSVLYFPFRDKLLAIDTKTGQSLWDEKAHKGMGRVRDIHITNKGILTLSTTGIYMVNASTGVQEWKKPLKLKGASESLLVQDGDDFFAVSKKYLVKVDINKPALKQLTDKIKFDGGETFTDISVEDDMVVLSSFQNIVGIDKNSGKINYQVYYKKPGASFATIAGNIALAAVAAAATMSSYANNMHNADAFGNFTYYQYTPAYISEGGSRTLESDQYMYISTKFKDADANGFGLAKVDRMTGETTDKIVIGDREPVYDVDEGASVIYFKSDKKAITCRPME